MTQVQNALTYRAVATFGAARAGVLHTLRGEYQTPMFMPVGTFGALRGILPDEARQLGFDIILGNTFHLWLQPGAEVVRRFGGLHGFGGWRGAILTDSGGYQIFSLRGRRTISERGALFQSPRDGSKQLLTPEVAMQVQRDLNSDIAMVLDQCIDARADEESARAAMELSCRWALRCRLAHRGNANAIFGIVQGGAYRHFRPRLQPQMKSIAEDNIKPQLPRFVRQNPAQRPESANRHKHRRLIFAAQSVQNPGTRRAECCNGAISQSILHLSHCGILSSSIASP